MDRDVLLLFGGLPHEYLQKWEITSNLTLAEEKLNVGFKEVTTDDLIAKTHSLTSADKVKAEKIADQLLNNALQNDQRAVLSEREVQKATELYVAMKSFVDEHDATAVTIVCGPWIREPEYPTPCIALMLFQESGIPAACQGDLDALLTMVLFKRASDVISCMGNNFKVAGELGVGHCVLSRQFCGSQTLLPYYVSDYHGRKPSPTVHTMIPVGGAVTLARLTQNLENLIITHGEIVKNVDLKDRCRNTLVIHVEDRNRVLNAMKGLQQHLVVACGDHTQALATQAEELGIQVIAV